MSRTTTESALADDGQIELDSVRPEAGDVRPSFDPFDPVALERRLAEARERRAVALANRRAGEAGRPASLPDGAERPARAPVPGPAIVPLRPPLASADPVRSDSRTVIARPVLRAEPRIAPVANAVPANVAAAVERPARRIGVLLPFGLGVVVSVAAATFFLFLPDQTSGVGGSPAGMAAAPASVPPVAGPAPTPSEVAALPDAAPPVAAPDAPVATTMPLPSEPFGTIDTLAPAPDALADAGTPAVRPPAAALEVPTTDAAPVAEAAPATAGVLAAILPMVTPQRTAPEPTSRTRVAYFPPPAPQAAAPVIALAQNGFETSAGGARASLRFGGPARGDLLAANGWEVAAVGQQPVAATRSVRNPTAVRRAESPQRVAAPPQTATAAPVVSQHQRALLNAQVEDLLKDRIRDIRRR